MALGNVIEEDGVGVGMGMEDCSDNNLFL
ncbi:uncharacterized protein G2W53_009433 [Senna tora]|uniref:Uncharacterized protein n=1 Tax=Senna tora TaxID=362788 RepID=A0A834WYG0_9FABA|nr:uncharacterized protein G2W53_009433 [Senna tora]